MPSEPSGEAQLGERLRALRLERGLSIAQLAQRTALSKGISNRRMLRRHAVPAAAAPVLTVAGVSVPVMVTNMVLVELTFSIPGMFQSFRSSMDNEDYPVIMGIVIAAAVLVALGSLLVDLALAWLDPKTRASS